MVMIRRGVSSLASSTGRRLSTATKTEAAASATAAGAAMEPPREHTSMTPRAIVQELDKHIIGQTPAKRAVAIALRNRWRRQLLGDELKAEIVPKNLLLIGPTGCGKTEIARRLAKLAQAPFIKVEATKFTEVGFHGRDVDQIIRDLVEVSIGLTRKKRADALRPEAQAAVENRILDTLTGANAARSTQSSFREMLRKGVLDDRQIDVDLPTERQPGGGSTIQLDQSSSITIHDLVARFQNMSNAKRTERKRMPIREARPLIEDMELEKLMDAVDIQKEAVAAVEESGIVFIDEIDKIVNSGDYRGADASAEGVQRDLLPLIEGSAVSTKYGNINTDYILFIASGAFSIATPSDLLAELQGRLPIRVELKALTEADMYRILTEPVSNLLAQQQALLATEHIQLEFSDDAIREIARVAYLANRTIENIGARRLHTCVERIMDDVSFEATDYAPGTLITIDKAYVQRKVDDFLVKSDLSKYIL
ncbi:hypothetical protein CTAYLR_010739 [Chrysophaeum taylorii]|uniref:Uncharacterized protein n=1 Tax=Chrysophaeum taylorii TaxID=2483200 RepID=A0AAD7XGR5_9STRA|nr:hypothetical protein CTAYLR_010739 [Chrysophaeum taylorii]